MILDYASNDLLDIGGIRFMSSQFLLKSSNIGVHRDLVLRIDTDKNRISQNIVKRIESCKLLLKRFKMRTPKDRIDDYYLKIDSLVKSMDNCIKMKTMSLRRQLAEQAAKLDALSPLQTLSRGYSIPTKEDGTVIRSANDMEKGMEFTLRMKDGQTNCVVKGE